MEGPGVVLNGTDWQDYLRLRFSHQISSLSVMYGLFFPPCKQSKLQMLKLLNVFV